MKTSFELVADPRDGMQGKGASRRLRRSGKVPAILYGGHNEPRQIILDHQNLLTLLADRFPHHTIYCDLMRKSCFERVGRDIHLKIVGMGTTFTDMVEQPAQQFLDAGYTMTSLESIPLYAARHGDIGMPVFVLKWFLPWLRDGYQVGVFTR